MKLTHYLYSATWFLPIRIFLSSVYGFIVWTRNKAYDSGLFKTYSVKTPVISVGNISVGGSGKTILVQALLEHFVRSGKKPAVLSRGYGRSSRGLLVVADENGLKAAIHDAGDEPYLIASNYPGVPIVVSEDRFKGAQYLEKYFNPDVIILDDGFQHRRLHRDLDILIIDFQNSPKPRLLPWGFLRESMANMSRADVVVYSKDGQQITTENNLILELDSFVENHRGETKTLMELKGDFGVFAGLGNPDYFFNDVEAVHGSPIIKISFPDHAKYSALECAEIEENSCDYWITTHKDFIKLEAGFCKTNNIYFIGVKTSLPAPVLKHLKATL